MDVETVVAYHIHKALVAVAGELAKVGISKSRQNDQQHFRFRGIDDVMNVVSPILAKHQIVFLVHYDPSPDVERVTGKGATLIHARVQGTFTFISAVDGSEVSVSTPGTAMDSGDKAMNKAMSASLKYALLQTFLIPTESNEDADSTTPEPSVPKSPVGFDEWFAETCSVKEKGVEAIRAAWGASPKEFRDYTLTYRATEWTAAKAYAVKVTEATKGAKTDKAAPEPAAAK